LTQENDILAYKLDRARKILKARANAGENLGFDWYDVPTQPRKLELTPGQARMYAAHPRLDLFVDGNSPHPMEKMGCTICHNGQGSATSFTLASHSPADSRQAEEWHKEYEWQH